VEVVAAYRTLLPEGPDARVREALEAGEIDAVTFTSASTVDNFCALVGSEGAPGLLAATVVACIGPITRDAALARGLACHVMPAEYTIPGLCDALAQHFAGAARK
jgi:uroporphyrinogen III methyltransferase/synthase